ncbi:MAG TPA: lysophospholipid acyltransferase family protein [Candidatus Omnitrophota bacterium]|jgi:KDO2-lipid IV(A) lauroyltransferase|nr:MAG: Lipid A biosynthesis lauroyl acyltransferase [Candidatus Omnitrophica bacterium ADurb.Bin314]HOE68295.1 lysophospholipid acyltransferase family protein [Candidatus Omnitrophota bacterium]HPW65183.1 lysophospholipid acyltransferase family protein [Candidatus Omnitrophota bacterium]HQB94423.1 lysophospholipid acyltransferase family protein [Candidatus Omnitrophota bacterium]
MIHFLEYLAASALIALAKALPVRTAAWIACRFADLSYWILPARRRVALGNVGKAFGDSLAASEKRSIVRSAFRSAALSMMELFIVEKTAATARQHFKLLNNERLEKAFAAGKGVILVIAHLGSWEYLSFLPFLTGQPWSVIVKDIKNPHLDRLITKKRKVMTVNPVPKNNSIKTVLRELKQGRGAAILIDQWAGDDGIWTDFFGTPTSTTSIPARLARAMGSALVPACCLRTSPGEYEIHIGEPVSWDRDARDWESTVTKQLNAILEQKIREHPGQWLWGHRRWKPKPANLRETA